LLIKKKYYMFEKKRNSFRKIVKEYKDATPYEIWEGIRDNFIFAFISTTIFVFVATRIDFAVILGQLSYYYFLGRILNRPKYVTSLGRMIVFPIPSTLGAFTGYKLSYYLLDILK
jgi:hypothetical protein